MIRSLNKYKKTIKGRKYNVHRQQTSIINYFDR